MYAIRSYYGFKPGYEGVIKVIVSNIRELYTTDHYGTSVQDIPMMDGIQNIQQMDLVCGFDHKIRDSSGCRFH